MFLAEPLPYAYSPSFSHAQRLTCRILSDFTALGQAGFVGQFCDYPVWTQVLYHGRDPIKLSEIQISADGIRDNAIDVFQDDTYRNAVKKFFDDDAWKAVVKIGMFYSLFKCTKQMVLKKCKNV